MQIFSNIKLQVDNNMKSDKKQDANNVLHDISRTGKERPWKEKKTKNTKLAKSYKRIGKEKKARRVGICGTRLLFAECPHDGYKKLKAANFCGDRLCPMCNWRRSRMLSDQIIKILHEAAARKNMKFIFLTLTARNCKGEELEQNLDNLFEGIKRLFKYKEVNNAVMGYVRALEVTRNANKRSKSYNTYHPHFHVLIGVNSKYFKGTDYIKKDRWIEMWQKALKIDYKPSVKVQKVKDKRGGNNPLNGALEVGKYAVKDADYIVKNPEETDKAVEVLSKALRNRRLIAYGKLFKTIKKELNLQDVESEKADLVGEDKKECKCPICQSNLEEHLYRWHFGLKNYYEISERS